MSSVAIIIFLNLLFYSRTLNYGLISDDKFPARWKPPEAKTKFRLFWKMVYYHFRGRYYNVKYIPLLRCSHILLHTFNAILIYLIFGSTPISLMAALLFSLNPNNVAIPVWLATISYSLGATFVLLMVYFRGVPIVAGAFYVLAMYQGVGALLTPLLTGQWVLLPLIPLVYWKVNHPWVLEKIAKTSLPEMKTIRPRKLIIGIRTVAYYFCQSIFPAQCGVFHTWMMMSCTSEKEDKESYALDKWFWGGLALGLTLIAYSIFNWSLGAYALVWYVVCIAVWSDIIILHQPYAERYAYLANVGAMVALSYGIWQIPDVTIRMMVYTLLLCYYGWRSMLYGLSYRTQYSYAYDNYMNFPDSSKAIFQLAVEDMNRQSMHTALWYYKKGAELYPYDFQLNFNLASIQGRLGDPEGGLKTIEKCESLLWTIAQPAARETFKKHLQDNRTITYQLIEMREAKEREKKKATTFQGPPPRAWPPERRRHAK